MTVLALIQQVLNKFDTMATLCIWFKRIIGFDLDLKLMAHRMLFLLKRKAEVAVLA